MTYHEEKTGRRKIESAREYGGVFRFRPQSFTGTFAATFQPDPVTTLKRNDPARPAYGVRTEPKSTGRLPLQNSRKHPVPNYEPCRRKNGPENPQTGPLVRLLEENQRGCHARKARKNIFAAQLGKGEKWTRP